MGTPVLWFTVILSSVMLRNITNNPDKHTSPKTRISGSIPAESLSWPPALPNTSVLDLERVFEIDLLRHLDCSEIFGKLGRTNAFFAKNVQREDVWMQVCQSFGKECGLYVPGDFSAGWKRLFWDQLWCSRKVVACHTEEDAPEAVGDFKIEVCTRFKPGNHRNRDDFLVPLHQRLKLLKKGEKLNTGDQGLGRDALSGLMKGADLPEDILDALSECDRLSQAGMKAQRDASGIQGREGFEPVFGWPADNSPGTDMLDADDALSSAIADTSLAAAPQGAARTTDRAEYTSTHLESGIDEGKDDLDLAFTRKGGSACVLAVQSSRVIMYQAGLGIRPFVFKSCFDEKSRQQSVYGGTARPAVISVLNGMNACLLCYGQTGSGKSFTIFGPEGVFEANSTANAAARGMVSPDCGVALRACAELLQATQEDAVPGVNIQVFMSYVQVYQETCTDLLSGQVVNVRDAGLNFHLQGCTERRLDSLPQALDQLKEGEQRKQFASTAMNDHSSRAHTLLLFRVNRHHRATGSVVESLLSLVDLAGCEQLKQSKATGQRLQEAVGINSSLLVLGKVISALTKEASHVPYNESKLTKLLKGAFGGNSRTTAIITASTDDSNGDQTYQALSFGERCSQITNRTKVAVTSMKDAVSTIENSLVTCQRSLQSLESRNKMHLPAYLKLKEKYTVLCAKRRELGDLSHKIELEEAAKASEEAAWHADAKENELTSDACNWTFQIVE